MSQASHLFIKGWDGKWEIVKIETDQVSVSGCFFNYRGLRYEYHSEDEAFSASEFNCELPLSELYQTFKEGGLQMNEVDKRSRIFGECLVKIDSPSYLKLFYKEVSHPFFIFQTYAVLLWILEGYEIFALTILVISVLSVFMNICEEF